MSVKDPSGHEQERPLAVLCGEVIHGKRLGHTLGFPTANLPFFEGDEVPAYGIYASTVEIDGREYIAVSNVGIRPTVDGEGANCETHIIDYCSELYGKKIKVTLHAFLREERKFSSVEELRCAIEGDIRCAVKYFENQ